MATNRYDDVELNVTQFHERLRSLTHDVDSCLLHDPHGSRIEPMFLDAGRVRLDRSSLQSVRPALGHLAAARIPGAKKQNG